MTVVRFVAFTWLGRAAVGALVIALVGATVVAPRLTAVSPPAATRTATVAKANLSQTVAVSGSVNASAQVKAAFKSTGTRLTEILVKVGDAVTAGQALARIDATDLVTAVRQAEASLLSAQAKYDATVAGVSPEDAALAKNALDSAQLNYDQSKKTTATDVTNAQTALDKAKRALTDAKTTTANDLAAALQSWNKTKTNYSSARTTYASLTGAIVLDLGTYRAALPTLHDQVKSAQSLVTDPGLSDVSGSLSSAEQSMTNAELAASTLAAAIADYQRAVDGIAAAASAFDGAVAASTDTSSVSAQYQSANTTYSLATSALTSAIDSVAGYVTSANTSVLSASSGLNTTTRRANDGYNSARIAVSALVASFGTETGLSGSAKTKVTQAGTNLTTITDAVNGGYITAQTAYASAQTKAQTAVQSAQDAVTAAEQTLATAQDKVGSTLAAQDITLSNAQVNYTKSTATPKPSDVASALSSLQTAQISVDKAKADLDAATLRAPLAGVIASVTNQVGEAPANPFAVIAVTGVLALHGTIGESEVAKLKVGQVATIAVDAVGSATRLTGKVTGLDPIATVQQGVPVYGVDVTIDRPDPAVRAGMTGTATVIIASKQGVLTVPNTAIRTVGGQRTVQVMRDGVAEDATGVVFGISNDTVTEVVSGLQEGQLVALPAPRTTTTTTQGQGGQRQQVQFGPGGAPPVFR
jgi:multidrug efflux pump subunit AcrA (membrane-fusion protein)